MRMLIRKELTSKDIKLEKALIEKIRALKDNELLEVEYPHSGSMPRREYIFKGIRGYWIHGISLSWNNSAIKLAKLILGHYEEEDMYGRPYCPDKPSHITKNRIPAKDWRRGEW